MIRTMKLLMLVTDIGFVLYWLITIFHLIPAELLFRDYTNSLLVHWNWSFLPLDLAISATGLSALWLLRKQNSLWRPFTVISLTLTSVSGLQAVAFWLFAGDFNLTWWLPNLFLLIYPLVFLPRLITAKQSAVLLVFVSPPGSGKTYFSTRFVKKNNYIRIGSDTIREAMFAHPDYSLEERQLVYEKMNQMIKENLQQGNNVILDGNLLTNDDRHKVFKRFKQYGKVIFLTLNIDFDYTLQRAIEIGNPLDPHHGKHIRAMYKAFEPLDKALPSIAIKPDTYRAMEKQLKQELQIL